MTPYAQWFVLAVVLVLFGLLSVNFWLILIGYVMMCLSVLYHGWKLINF